MHDVSLMDFTNKNYFEGVFWIKRRYVMSLMLV